MWGHRCAEGIGIRGLCSVLGVARRGSRIAIRCGRSGGLWMRRCWLCRRISRRCTPGWAVINPAREAASSAVTAGVLFGAVGAAADGAARLQSAVRWFVGLSLDTPIWDANVFTKNRDRLVDGEVA